MPNWAVWKAKADTQRRTRLLRRLPQTATILVATPGAVDRLNQPTLTWTASGTTPCRIEQVTGNEAGTPAGDTAVTTYRIYTPPTAAVTPQSRLASGGQTYDVLSVSDAAGAGHHLEILARLVA